MKRKSAKPKTAAQIEATKKFYETLYNMSWEPLASDIKARIEANKRQK